MSLNVVVPFNPKDAQQAVAMFDWFADLCGQQNRTVILAHEELTPSADVARAASRAFTKVEHLIVTACADAWPISANCYFACVAAEMRGREPWLWCEGDCVALHPLTVDRLEAGYVQAGKPCYGPIIPAYFLKNGVWIETGKMLAGVSLYHPNLWDHSPLLRALRATQNAYAAAAKAHPEQKAAPKAFDCYLAGEILPVAADTRLIQHMGRSREFRRENGQIVCTYGPESRWNPMVQPETVLVHGQKDGSLITLLRAEMNLPARQYAGVAETPVVIAAKQPRAAAPGLVWSDEKERDEKPATRQPEPTAEPTREPPPTLPATVNKEAIATLGDARQAIQHWPDCTGRTFFLHEALGRYRVACQCGASSPKLPEGVDWELAWKATAVDKIGASTQTHPASGELDSINSHKVDSAGSIPASRTTFDEMIATASREITPPTHIPKTEQEVVPQTGQKPPASPASSPDASNGAKPLESAASPAAMLDFDEDVDARVDHLRELIGPHWDKRLEIIRRQSKERHMLAAKANALVPLSKLRTDGQILARFPKWAKLSPRMRLFRINTMRKREREDKVDAAAKEYAAKAKRPLTEEARKRKPELIAMSKGKKGAFLKLRNLANTLGVKNVASLKRDHLILAILEREFANPYEDFAEAKA